jgi:hypothetical protein
LTEENCTLRRRILEHCRVRLFFQNTTDFWFTSRTVGAAVCVFAWTLYCTYSCCYGSPNLDCLPKSDFSPLKYAKFDFGLTLKYLNFVSQFDGFSIHYIVFYSTSCFSSLHFWFSLLSVCVPWIYNLLISTCQLIKVGVVRKQLPCWLQKLQNQFQMKA